MILCKIEPYRYDGLSFCYAGEDTCQVRKINAKFSKINMKIEGKMEYFREVINSAGGRNEKRKPPFGEYIRMSKLKAQRDANFLLRAKLSI